MEHQPRPDCGLQYFRTCTTDAYQGPAEAIYAREHGFKTVYVTDNKGTYGIGPAGAFKAEALKIGLTVLGQSELDPNNLAISAQSLATTIAGKKPDLIYFGGEHGSQGGANGALATTVGGDPTKDPNARAFLAAEKARFPSASGAAYDTYAYDAATAIIDAFARAIKHHSISVGQPMTTARRLAIARQVQASDFQGASGPVSFDTNSDARNHTIGVYKVVNRTFVFQAVAPKVQ